MSYLNPPYENSFKELCAAMPLFYLDVFEMREILKAQGHDLDSVGDALELIINNNYILTADEPTIKNWETFLGLVNPPDMTLEERRSQVAAMFYPASHIGEPEIKEIFKFFSAGSIDVSFLQGQIELAISLASDEVLSVAAFLQVLARKIPAHLSLHIVFQTKVGLHIGTRGRGFTYRSPMTGAVFTGVWPQRNTAPGLADNALDVTSTTAKFLYNAPAAGTRPYRNTPAGIAQRTVQIDDTAEGFAYSAVPAGTHEAGTIPGQATVPGIDAREIRLTPEAKSFSYTFPVTGKVDAGSAPRRSSEAALANDEVSVEPYAKGYSYAVPAAGRTQTGTTPQREAGAAVESNTFFAAAEAKGFRYTVKLCGTSYCKS